MNIEDQIRKIVREELELELARQKPKKQEAKTQYLNKTQAAKYLGKSFVTFNKWVHEYNIPVAYVDGKPIFSSKDLDDFIKRRKN